MFTSLKQAHIQNVVWGSGEVECLGTRNRGTEGADGGGVWSCAPRKKNFGMFSFEMVHFDAFWSTF